ncbi:amidinotransferase [Aliiruegeria haliotis]|uniref:Amidinotransferase n=1 Tax=Aliiruegeria haliotis TaxID=1280846 RepID=A0A2T0S0P6_9RHOB|nr:hypothetical protein [Aliiruegeria haliotis]PRY26942.1 amidinotransferase [Aliiruegeria haliotis]
MTSRTKSPLMNRRNLLKLGAALSVGAAVGRVPKALAASAPQATASQKGPGDAYFRDQAKGIRCYVESEWAPLKACMVGHPHSLYISDPNTPESQNMLAGNASPELLQFLNTYKGQNLKDADPALYEVFAHESDMLAKNLRDAGVHVIRNESGQVADELINYSTGWGRQKYCSLFMQAAFEVVGHCLVSTWEASPSRPLELEYRAAVNEIMQNDPEAVWLTMPAPYPSRDVPTPAPFLSAGDFRIMGDKTLVLGYGVSDPSHIKDRTKGRSSGDEFGGEILRRMLAAYGWTVEEVYFNRNLSYHIDCVMMVVDEGLIGLPENGLFTPLSDKFRDWQVFTIPQEELKAGIGNSIPLGNKRILVPEGGPKTVKELERRGYTVIETPYQTIYGAFASGIHCSTAPLWREA